MTEDLKQQAIASPRVGDVWIYALREYTVINPSFDTPSWRLMRRDDGLERVWHRSAFNDATLIERGPEVRG